MSFIAIGDLAPFDSLRGQEQRSSLLAARWFCCNWSQAWWPPDTHSARPDVAAVRAMRTSLAIDESKKG